ncbi:site-specific recombinase XerD [Sporosarcina luteola]|nr:site-specific recombinase XerD [Sporosarcina luteola]
MIFGTTNNYFSPEAIAKVLKEPQLNNPTEREHFLIMNVLYETGAHVAEILNVQSQDLNLAAQPSIRLSSLGIPRSVPLPGFLTEAVRQHMKEKKLSPADRLFFHDRNITSMELCRLLRVYIRRVKIQFPKLIPDFHSIHHFRISRANHLYQTGMDIEDLCHFLGQRSISETKRYVRILYHSS